MQQQAVKEQVESAAHRPRHTIASCYHFIAVNDQGSRYSPRASQWLLINGFEFQKRLTISACYYLTLSTERRASISVSDRLTSILFE
jgi:hypothetical protein